MSTGAIIIYFLANLPLYFILILWSRMVCSKRNNNCVASLICTLFTPLSHLLILLQANFSSWVSSFSVELKLGNHFWLIHAIYWFHVVTWQEMWILYSKYFVNPTPGATSFHINCMIVKDIQQTCLSLIPSPSTLFCFLINQFSWSYFLIRS